MSSRLFRVILRGRWSKRGSRIAKLGLIGGERRNSWLRGLLSCNEERA
jgi:hypothetical protein